jgi:coenzyme F420 hydrogenase subunit beta
VLELWDGYAKDPEIRYNGSSGGVATALALYCLETGRFSGALHVRAKLDVPLQNTAVLSKTREDLLAGAGSRYSPAAPCERFDLIEQAESDCVFIGKPCDVAALRKSQSVNAALASKVGLVISIFCAATPCSQGTQVLLESLGVEPEDVAELRYRGCGWPGMTVVKLKGANGRVTGMSYEQSWGKILSRYGQLRCRLCPDSTGELADISCGDPWYREIEPEEPGRSLVLVRTERGRKTLREAMDKDYIVLERVGWSILPRSQMSLLEKRRNIFGRLFSMKLLGVPTPKFRGFSLFANWRVLSLTDKIRSIGGTMRRIVWRGWFRPRNHSHPM